ncbi:hypothetical protein [Legionella septentrionalis]|uniref:Uncharacterized protein n=1 Tax=Legionella septentrionalis TaxID=2498109 RepID=A0A433JG74_9GAMM|nr:hypothetical protein [Legionella septentrionalis]RUQ78146.1 hypothetical protein EKM59_11830 [Legionella septentrionalis]RUQ92015.1 hypothetical protein ELY11_12300 [Legionella septentrionalis]RUR08397.1 hypothetical protein ELY14_11335 [Legionella septentrionalis]
MRPIIHKDMLGYAQELKQQGMDVVVLNPGSDRTIGGSYPTENPDTLEEKIAQKSDLVLLHSVYNQSMVDAFKIKFSFSKTLGNVPKVF